MKRENRKCKFAIVFIVALIVVFGLLPLSGCAPKTGTSGPGKISVSFVSSPLNVPSILEKQKRLFEGEFRPAAVEWLNLTTGPQQTQALASGDLNFAHAIGATSVLLAASQGVGLKIVGVYSRGPKSFMILAKNNAVASIADLRGKKIGGPKGTVLDQLLAAALKTQGLTEQDVDFISMDIPLAAAALENGSIDAALLAGPAALKAEDAGARLITDGQGLTNGTIFTVVTRDFYAQHRETVDRFTKVHREAVDYMLKNEPEVLAMAAKETGLTQAQTDTLYRWYDFDPAIRPEDIAELRLTQDFLLESGLQRSRVDIDTLFDKY